MPVRPRSSRLFSAATLLLLHAGPVAAQVAPPETPQETPQEISAPQAAPETASEPFAVRDVPLLADADDLFAPLPEIPTATELPPVDFGEPLAMDPVAPLDPALLAPLPSLQGFDPAPSADFKFTEVAQEGIRYRTHVDGLDGTGLEGSFRRLSALVRGENQTATAAQLASRTNSDKLLMQRLLFSEGWYSGETEASVSVTGEGRADVRLQTMPGERYRWSEIALDLIPTERPELAEGFGLKVGEPIRAIAVEESEGALLRKLNESGYPFAEIGARDVVLDQTEPTGSYLLTGDIGPAGVFGPIRMSGFQPFSEDHARVIARFEAGEPYDVRMVDDLRRALIATQQFGGVTVSPVDSGLREPDGRAVTEIRIVGNRGPQRLLSGQVGYASQEGFRAEGSWRHRNFIRPEGTLTTRAVLGTEEQRLAADLLMGNWRQRDRTLALGADIANLTPPAYKAQTLAVTAEIARQSTPIWQKRWTWSLGFGLGASREQSRAILPDDPELPKRTFLFVSIPGTLGYDRSNDLLDPTKGYRLKLEMNPEISREGKRVETYARMFLEGSGYQRIRDDFVLAGRARVGSIVGADLVNIAPTRRLYAGGGGSVRGYDYQGVGILGSNDRPIGGRGLLEGSVEGRYRFGDFGVVGFVDAGSVSPDPTPTLDGMRFGVGVGGRYFTSFGPIRFDIARAVNRSPRDPKIALYISIGQAF
nr:BamA/TamA family outer membrane protein [Sandaracinobacteroides sayramensis]